MARIGEILLEHGWVDSTSLERALAEQSLTGGRRICSLLISRGLLDPDHAARALGELHGVPAVMQRHLEHRDRSLEKLLSPTFARAYFALPIGKTRTGEVIVAARDPGPDLQAALERVITHKIMLAVAPAAQLEQLIDTSYEAVDEFDVNLDTGNNIERPDGLLEHPEPDIGEFSLADLDDERVTKQEVKFEAQRTTPPPFVSATPPHGWEPPTNRNPVSPFASVTPPEGFNPPTNRSPFASLPEQRSPSTGSPLAAAAPEPEPEADDLEIDLPPVKAPDSRTRISGASSSPYASGLATGARPPTTPPPLNRPTPPPHPPSTPPSAVGTEPPGRPKLQIPPLGQPAKTPTGGTAKIRLSIDDLAKALADAVTRDVATDVVMRYVSRRWSSSLLLAVKEGAALGHRGHGPQLTPVAIRAVAIPLTTPSIVKAAYDNGELTTTPPPGSGAIQERLVRLLGDPKLAIAAPVYIGGVPACVLVVGDPVDGGNSATDLDRLSELLGETYTRIQRDMK